ncbi:hypothetical protein B0J14DRAFT_585032 [Halenospora varia]|nr:hypothetical protein B0J14DRAFT_585032 [Halenospora varia]
MSNALPTRVLAGVTVPDTPLITKAIEFARSVSDDFTYNHVMRSWLFGQFMCDATPDLKDHDVELHAITAILHDLGWPKSTVTGSDIVTKDKRFEVDGANAAREFLIREGNKEHWDKRRLQLAWDTIALHTTPSIGMYKEKEVGCCGIGITADFLGPEKAFGGVLTRQVWDGIVKEYPRLDFRNGVKKALCGLCIEKPETTYDNFVAQFGVLFVDGYSLEGKTMVDIWRAAED